MSVKRLLLIAVLGGSLAVSAHAAPAPTGPFGLPYNENQSWSACSSVGWVPYGDPNSHQYHMQFYSAVGKYHMGEDWNGKCGGDTDKGAPLLAIADGEVVYIDNSPNGTVQGQGKRLYIRHSFPYALAPAGVMTFDSALLHLDGMGNRITGKGISVTKGETIAYLGKTGTDHAHLHWEAQTDLNIPLGTNPYQNPLTKSHALRYRAPSLIVDDRRDVRSYAVAVGNWSFLFTMQGNAPSSTMYVSRNGQHKSLKNAIAAGWIPSQGMIFEKDGRWYYYYDVDANFFENGRRYGFGALVSGVSFNILVPRNAFQQDRARLDMIRAVENNLRFANVLSETYGRDPNWDPAYELHWMSFGLSAGGDSVVITAVNKANPLKRYTNYLNPDTSQWVGWQLVNWNRLY